MASDNLNQLGKHLAKTRRDVKHSSRHIFSNLPLIEETADIVGPINRFKFEFKTYSEDSSVLLNLIIKKRFKSL